MKDKDFAKIDDKKFNNNKVKQLDKEHQELVDLLQLKNRQIKEVIDNLRSIVWEINTMLAMRKP
jgi:mediator of RNA polymerase II transcription subunit 30